MDNVLIADEDVVVVTDEVLQSLRSMARAAPLRRARLCLHRQSEDPIQEMVIAFARDSYVQPHRHQSKSESFHVLEGLLLVVLFDDAGRITRRIPLGPPGSGRSSLYRLSTDDWHTILIESDSVILHETTNGPYVPGKTEFAAWAPDAGQQDEAAAFVKRLRSESLSTHDPPASDALPHTDRPRDSAARRKVPTLTAIVCNYNHGHLVGRALEAMLTQSRPADELIVVDDGSTDDSVAVIRSWVERHPSIRFFQNERNLGFHASLQRALSLATGDYVYSGAADDRVLPGFFEAALSLAAAHPQAGAICGQIVGFDPSGRELLTVRIAGLNEAVYLDPRRFLRDVLEAEPPTHSLSGGTIFQRQALLGVGGMRAELGSWGDTFALRAIGLQHGVCYWPHPAMAWLVLPGSLSQTTRADPQRAWRIVDRAAELMRSDPFRALFPPDHVERWVRGYRQAIVHDQLQAVIEGNQAVQSCCRSVAETANPLLRLLLGALRFSMQVSYFVIFRLLRFVVARRLARTMASETQTRC